MLATLALLVSAVLFILVRFVPTPTPPGKGSVHFTIPILSPFASVVRLRTTEAKRVCLLTLCFIQIEHETSAVNVPLVAVLLLSAGIALFVWLRCCGTRR